MTKISKKKISRIKLQILSLLSKQYPKKFYTAQIAEFLARDEEFTKKILISLKKEGLVEAIREDDKGNFYTRRIKWKMKR